MPVLAILALLAADDTPLPPTVSVTQLRAIPAEQLADAILPAGHPRIVRTRIGYGGQIEPEIAHFLFYPKVKRQGAHFCRQVTIDAPVTPIATMGAALPETIPMPRPTGWPTMRVSYRYRAPNAGCDGTDQFFTVDRGSVRAALKAVHLLYATAVAMQKSGVKQPPFPASCDFYRSRNSTSCDSLALAILGSFGDIRHVSDLSALDSAIATPPTLPGRRVTSIEMRWIPRGTDITMVTYHGRIERLTLTQTEISE